MEILFELRDGWSISFANDFVLILCSWCMVDILYYKVCITWITCEVPFVFIHTPWNT